MHLWSKILLTVWLASIASPFSIQCIRNYLGAHLDHLHQPLCCCSVLNFLQIQRDYLYSCSLYKLLLFLPLKIKYSLSWCQLPIINNTVNLTLVIWRVSHPCNPSVFPGIKPDLHPCKWEQSQSICVYMSLFIFKGTNILNPLGGRSEYYPHSTVT